MRRRNCRVGWTILSLARPSGRLWRSLCWVAGRRSRALCNRGRHGAAALRYCGGVSLWLWLSLSSGVSLAPPHAVDGARSSVLSWLDRLGGSRSGNTRAGRQHQIAAACLGFITWAPAQHQYLTEPSMPAAWPLSDQHSGGHRSNAWLPQIAGCTESISLGRSDFVAP